MHIQSWMIKSWATLEWYLPPEREQLPSFSHVSTQVRDDGGHSGLRAGDTVWTTEYEQWQAGLAWEWVEVQPDVVMMTDPNSVITNLHFVDYASKQVCGLARTVVMNRLVHALPWQAAVCALLRAQTKSAGLSRASTLPSSSPLLPLANCTDRLEHPAPEPLLPSVSRHAFELRTHALPDPSVSVEHNRRTRCRATDRESGVEILAPRQELRRAA